MRQLTRVELDKMKKLYGFEEVGQETLTSFVKDIEKGIASGDFTREEIGDFANVEVNSYTPIQVIGPDLSKTIRFIRHQQVRWGNPDDIVKSIADKDGIYLDTDRNQKLGLVGMPYDYDIIKGKKVEIGEIRYYGGIPYRKVTSTGNANKDWQRVKDMPKKPGAKGGEKHEEVKEVKVDMPEGFKIGDIVESKNDADMPTSVRDVLGKVVGSVKGTTSVPLYLKVDTGTTVHEVNPNYMMKQSGDKEKEEEGFKIEEKVRFEDNYGELREGVITKIEGDMVHGKQINSPNSFIRNKKDVVRLKQAEPKLTPEKKELTIKSTEQEVYDYFEALKGKKVSIGSGSYLRSGSISNVEILNGDKISNTGVFVNFLEDGDDSPEKIKVNFSDKDTFTVKSEKKEEPKTESSGKEKVLDKLKKNVIDSNDNSPWKYPGDEKAATEHLAKEFGVSKEDIIALTSIGVFKMGVVKHGNSDMMKFIEVKVDKAKLKKELEFMSEPVSPKGG